MTENLQNIPSRETFNKLSKRALDILKPDGTDAILDDSNLTLKEARSVTKDLRILPESKADNSRMENVPDQIEHMLDDISNGEFFKLLNPKFDILLPDMKIDVSLIDTQKTIERCRTKIKEIDKQLEERKQTEEIPVKISNLEDVLRAELDSSCETFKKLNAKMANVEISEDVDMAKKRNLELEDRLRKMCDIVKCIKMTVKKVYIIKQSQTFVEDLWVILDIFSDEDPLQIATATLDVTEQKKRFVHSKSEIVKAGETTQKNSDQQPAGNIVEYAKLVEKLLADTDAVTYTLTNGDNL